ncbi:MAG: 30S ribosomal protein THX [Saprospiraceae bacterium]|jgi:ribosomal small subunit protein bTHX
MGKGDKKTKKGKRWRGSYGKTRGKKPNAPKKSS